MTHTTNNTTTHITMHIRLYGETHFTALRNDPLVYPQLHNDLFEPELTFAQRLRGHIRHTLTDTLAMAEDPESNLLY